MKKARDRVFRVLIKVRRNFMDAYFDADEKFMCRYGMIQGRCYGCFGISRRPSVLVLTFVEDDEPTGPLVPLKQMIRSTARRYR